MDATFDTRTTVSNVLVIGSGAAGLRAAIAAHDAGGDVIVLGKRRRRDAHTVLASGGINAALGTVDPEDSWQQHFADTLQEGYFLADPRTVEIMAREAPDAIHELVDWGCPLARKEDGEIDQRYFGAHTYRRTCYAGDYTGRAVLQTLDDQMLERDIPVLEEEYVSRLLVHDGTCFGAVTFNIESGDRTVFFADAVVLAAGGHTRLWRRSSSRRDENTGDGLYLALEAGCRLVDVELVQFHPTGMVAPEEMAGQLVTEAMRGEGARLYNAEGERFMERYDPQRLELSTRDRVALANYTEIAEGRGGPNGGVFLDITHRSREDIANQLPRMYRQFLEHQMIDIAKERVEVAPTAHYSMGGVAVDPETHATDVEGLYAAGEVAAGLHGANRLGGNSLIETVIFGRRAGEAAAAFSASRDVQLRHRASVKATLADLDSMVHEGDEFARPLQRALRNTMWEHGGVVRSEEGLKAGLDAVADLSGHLERIDVRPTSEGWGDLAHALDFRASLRSAEATLRGALERRESRGAHNRSDHTDLDPDLQVNLHIRLEDGELRVEAKPVPPVPSHLEEWAQATGDVEVAGRLLE
jgi:succinate dehydrogenase / fumarate reductase, flavoprotein subunit